MQEEIILELYERTLERDYVFKGKVINVRRDTAQLPKGKAADREVIEHTGGVTIAALTDNDELLFVRQFRYPIGEVLMELPAGKLKAGKTRLPPPRVSCLKRQALLRVTFMILAGFIHPLDIRRNVFIFMRRMASLS